jgi:hypothetical protein
MARRSSESRGTQKLTDHLILYLVYLLNLLYLPKQKWSAEERLCRPNESQLLQPPALETFAAWGPLGPWTISNSTGSPSCKVR